MPARACMTAIRRYMSFCVTGYVLSPEVGENTQTVWLIDWKNAENNHFALAEEVTVKGANAKASTKRPDIVLYINGIALACWS